MQDPSFTHMKEVQVMNVRRRIENALSIISEAAAGANVEWVVGGSAGLMLRGLSLTSEPRDLDIYSDDADVDRLYGILQPYAVDKPQLSESGIYRSILSHYMIEGISVELVGGFVIRAHGCRYETEVRSVLLPFSEPISLHDGSTIPVVPLAHELWFNVLRDRLDRSQLIIDAYSRHMDRHSEAMEALEQRNQFSAEAKDHMHRWIADRHAGVLL